ncbi:MAG: helix-turn-helix domain-containing protein [Proteobacteria bacterium]|nr:helix-turn-helix domain-containing protein [Pseudomonadota bacterium]
MNYDLLTQQLLKAIRNRRSQAGLSRKLGYSGNQIYRWEAGLRSIAWSDLTSLAKVCKIDLKAVVHKSIGCTSTDPQVVVTFLIGTTKIPEAASKLQISPQILRRWIRGNSSPSLVQVLQMLDILQGRLIDFLEHMVDCSQIDCLKARLADHRRRLDLNTNLPVANLVTAILETSIYQSHETHPVGFIAKAIGVSVESETEILSKLARVGAIRNTKGKFKVVPQSMEMKAKDIATTMRQRLFWTEMAAEYLRNSNELPQKSMFGWSVFSISDDGYSAIQTKFREFYAQVMSIANSDSGQKNNVKIMNLQCLDLEDFSNSGAKSPKNEDNR